MTFPAVRLSRVARTISGSGFPPAEQGVMEGDLPFVKVSDIASSTRSGLNGAANWVTTATAKRLGARTIPSGSTLFPKVGAALLNNNRAYTHVECVADNNVMGVVPTHGDPRYWHWVLNVTDMSLLSGGGTLPFVSDSDVRALVVPSPPLDEQRRIADFLDEQVALLDRAMELRSRQLEASHESFWTWLLERVSREDAPVLPLRRALDFVTDGPFGSAFASSDYAAEGPAVVRLGNIGFAEYKPGDQARVPESIWLKFPRCHVKPGDLLIATLGDPSNHAGRACVAPGGLGAALVKGKCLCARVRRDKASADFLALIMSSPLGADLFAVASRGSTRTMINIEILKSVRLPLPSPEVQNHIAQEAGEFRRDYARRAELLERGLRLLRERKQALITAAVTGRFDVTSARSAA